MAVDRGCAHGRSAIESGVADGAQLPDGQPVVTVDASTLDVGPFRRAGSLPARVENVFGGFDPGNAQNPHQVVVVSDGREGVEVLEPLQRLLLPVFRNQREGRGRHGTQHGVEKLFRECQCQPRPSGCASSL